MRLSYSATWTITPNCVSLGIFQHNSKFERVPYHNPASYWLIHPLQTHACHNGKYGCLLLSAITHYDEDCTMRFLDRVRRPQTCTCLRQKAVYNSNQTLRLLTTRQGLNRLTNPFWYTVVWRCATGGAITQTPHFVIPTLVQICISCFIIQHKRNTFQPRRGCRVSVRSVLLSLTRAKTSLCVREIRVCSRPETSTMA